MRRLRQLIRSENLSVHFPIEVRFVRADDGLLSPTSADAFEVAEAHEDAASSGTRRTARRVQVPLWCYIGIIMYRPFGRDVPHRRYFAAFERIMLALGGRPHWAKAFSLREPQLRELYPQFGTFCAVRERLDPQQVFCNDWVRRTLLPQASL
ncbi:MAG: hypothetical protein MHM6MM_008100 [Cercozoa sp. M6MM]